jgi:uncharacterized repeat protein (TIGR01451 family)
VTYEDANANTITQLSNIVTTTVSQLAVVVVDPDNLGTGEASQTVLYSHTVTNNGNAADTFDLTGSSASGWTVAVYSDANGNGLIDGADAVITDTGSIGIDLSVDIIVAVTLPAGPIGNGTSDITTVTATSQFDGTVSDSATDTTTVNSPLLGVVKSVSPAGNQPPGTVLTYSIVITNNGGADASNVVMTDPQPTNTTYQAGTIDQDGTGKTDVTGDDNADFGGTTVDTVTVTVGTLAASASTTITFDVQID